MSSHILLESKDKDIAEVVSIHVSRINKGYLLLLEGIHFFDDKSFFNIEKNIFLKNISGYSYLAEIDIVDSAIFNSNSDIILLVSAENELNINYLNFYSKLILDWNTCQEITWRNLSFTRKKIWLDACRDLGVRCFNIKSNIVINCNDIKDIPSLYCCLGEAFFGEKGYIGQNLDALDDFLLEVKHSNNIIYFENSNQLIKHLNTPKNKIKYNDEYVSILTSIFQKHGFLCQFL